MLQRAALLSVHGHLDDPVLGVADAANAVFSGQSSFDVRVIASPATLG